MASGRLRLHAAVELLPTVVRGSGHLQGSADIGNGLPLTEQLLGAAQLADDLYSLGEALPLRGCGVCVSLGFSWPSLAGREALIRTGSVSGVHVMPRAITSPAAARTGPTTWSTSGAGHRKGFANWCRRTAGWRGAWSLPQRGGLPGAGNHFPPARKGSDVMTGAFATSGAGSPVQ
jgi:hypothetical protein